MVYMHSGHGPMESPWTVHFLREKKEQRMEVHALPFMRADTFWHPWLMRQWHNLHSTGDAFNQRVFRAMCQASVGHHSHIAKALFWNTGGNGWTVKEDGCFEATVSRKPAAPQVLINNAHLYCSDRACIHAWFGMNQSLHYELTLPLIQPGLILHFLFKGSVTVYVNLTTFPVKYLHTRFYFAYGRP